MSLPDINNLRRQAVLNTTDNSDKKILVSKEIQTYRLNICKECEKYNKVLGTCKMCGCFMKFKTTLVKSYCPLLKWERHSEDV
jgi:hypothetical protein